MRASKYPYLHMARALLDRILGVVQVGSSPPGPCTAPLCLLAAFCLVIACNKTQEPTTSITPDPVQKAAASSPKKCPRPMPDNAPPVALPAKRCPPDPGPQPMLATTSIQFESGPSVSVEIARSEDETSRGLMYRTSMPEGRGMMFAFGMAARREHVFWMRNTCIPLDMMFIDNDGTIVGIEENVPTLDDTERSCGCTSTHVLEVNAGWSRRHAVKPGQKVKLPLP